MSFEGEQQKIAHTGNRKKFSVYISMGWVNRFYQYIELNDRVSEYLDKQFGRWC
ncbi:MAG: hypothetical protein WA667_26655 [Candidatus Nitrosopolaris sp.]